MLQCELWAQVLGRNVITDQYHANNWNWNWTITLYNPYLMTFFVTLHVWVSSLIVMSVSDDICKTACTCRSYSPEYISVIWSYSYNRGNLQQMIKIKLLIAPYLLLINKSIHKIKYNIEAVLALYTP